ncbi:MAG: ubiquitin-like small modifier protein 1 [Actinomycetota bacterium]
MAVLVRIPSQLQTLTGGEREVKVSGSTVGAILDELETSFPGFKERLLDENGEVRRFVNIYVDEEDVRFKEGLSTKVEEGSEISIIPAVAGGSS